MNENAIKSTIQQYIASNRVDATSRDLTRLYATSTTVGACADFRADTLSQVPMRVRNRKTKENAPEEHPLTRLFNGGYSTVDLMRRTELSMTFWGRNLIEKNRNVFNVVRELHWVNPNIYSLDLYMRSGLKGFHVYPSSMYKIDPVSYLDISDTVYMHGVDFDDDYEGTSEVERAFLEASVEPEKAQTQVAVFRNMAIPAAIAQPAANSDAPQKEDRDRLVDMLRRVVQGAVNAGRTVVSPKRWEWLTLQTPFKDLALKDISDETRLSVCVAMRMPLELIVPSAANYAQFEGARRTWGHAWLVPRVEWYASVFTEQLAREFGDEWEVYADLDAVPFLKEDAASRVNVVNAKVSAGYLSLYDAQKELGQNEPDEVLKDLYVVQGIPVPKEELRGLWKTHFASAQPSLGFGGTSTPALSSGAIDDQSRLLSRPQTETPPEPVRAVVAEATEAYAYLSLANDPAIVKAQAALKAALAGQAGINWQDPNTFHVTLVYCEAVDDAGIVDLAKQVIIAPVPITSTEYGVFENKDERALHLVIEPDETLTDLQAALYNHWAGKGLPLSKFSTPAAYKPHVTLAYLPAGVDVPATAPDVETEATRVEISRDNYRVYQSVALKRRTQKIVQFTTIPDNQYKELKDWQHVAERKGRDYSFKTYALPAVAAAYVRLALDDGEGVSDVFEAARDLLTIDAGKSYEDTKAAFTEEITRYLTEGQASETDRRNFAARMRSSLRRWGLIAFRDGMESTGYSPESFGADELKSFREWQAAQSGYVTSLGAEIFGQGISEAEIAIRARMWADISLEDAYVRGIMAGNDEARMEWVLGAAEKHCPICPQLHGQVHTVKAWRESGYQPGNGNTPCKQGCKCTLRLTDKAIQGTLPAIAGKHEHEHELEAEAA